MKNRKLFDIDIVQLRHDKHDYEFDVNSSFFANFEDSYAEKGSFKVQLTLDKSETLLVANFKINGNIELTCDRSLEVFDHLISTNNQLIFKYGTEYSELSDEIVTIPKDIATLNMAQYIYEFIGLAIPMKKLHPKFNEEEGEDEDEDSEGTLIYSTIKDGDEEEEVENKDETIDPRWDILNNLKNNLN